MKNTGIRFRRDVSRETENERCRALRRDRYINELIERGRYADFERRRHLRLLIMALGYGASLAKASAATKAALAGEKNMPDLGPFKVKLSIGTKVYGENHPKTSG
jgi:hypothetical protein